jgi:hypothetical protein
VVYELNHYELLHEVDQQAVADTTSAKPHIRDRLPPLNGLVRSTLWADMSSRHESHGVHILHIEVGGQV